MTFRPVPAAAAIVLGIAVSSIVPAAPAAGASSSGVPTDVALVVALTPPERTGALIGADLLANYTAENGLLDRELDQIIDRPVTIGIDPKIIVSIRVLGSAAPTSALAWLDRLAAASNETFPLSWADSNLTLPLQAGSDVVLAPTAFDFAIDPANFDAADTSTEPPPTPAPDTPVEEPTFPLPTTESLLAWDYTLPGIAWPAFESVVTSDLDALSTFNATLLSSGNVTGFTNRSAAGRVGDARVLIANAPLSSLFSDTVSAAPGAAWSEAAAILGNALVSQTAGATSAIIGLGRAVPLSDPDLGPTIDAISASQAVSVVGLSDIANAAPATVSILDKAQDSAAVSSTRSLLATEASDDAFSIIAADPIRVTSQRRLQLLSTLSNGWSQNPLGWENALAQFSGESLELQTSVQIVKSSSITLWADRGSLPVVVSSSLLDQDVTVYITVRPLSPIVKVENSFVPVTVEPFSQRKAQVPVESISNGIVELQVTLHRSDGVLIGSPTYVRTTVQAGWETPFTIALGVFVVLVFIVGIVRNVVRRRRAATTPAQDTTAPAAVDAAKDTTA